MPQWADIKLSGWGRVPAIPARAARPERMRELVTLLEDAEDEPRLAYGGGRSYGDVALNSRGVTILTTRLDRMLEFDPVAGTLVAEPGVRIGDVLDCMLPKGYTLPVVPGTGYATLGGAVANDVHGKNQHCAGSFGHHVEWLDLRLPDNSLQRVIAAENSPLFKATVGGLGLTGIVERVCVRLKAVRSNAVAVTRFRVPDLDEFLQAFEEQAAAAEYAVGWIDALARGRQLGRGILELAQPSDEGVTRSQRPRARRRVPFDFPAFVLNPYSVRMFNALYSRSAPSTPKSRRVDYRTFLFPLDALLDWNRIYGRRGFRQFQCLLPVATGRDALVNILERIARDGRGSFLAVLKMMGKAGLGYLSFPKPGYTLALDFPERPPTVELLNELEKMTREAGGRVYLAKDSTLRSEHLEQMYPQLSAYREVLEDIDPRRLMHSDLAERLGIRRRNG